MKAYKVFNSDWTCLGLKYEVGKTYKHDGEIKMCRAGFHACRTLIDCFKYYSCMPWNKYAVVELSGKIKHSDLSPAGRKYVAEEIKIVREISTVELHSILTGTPWEYGISEDSRGISVSEFVDGKGIHQSFGVENCAGASHIECAVNSNGITGSYGVNCGHGISQCWNILQSTGVQNSKGVALSHGVYDSQGVLNSTAVTNSIGIESSNAVFNSIGIRSCVAISDSLFAYGVGSRTAGPNRFNVFGKPVLYEEFNSYRHALLTALGLWSPDYTSVGGIRPTSKYRKLDPNTITMAGQKWSSRLPDIVYENCPISYPSHRRAAWSSIPAEAIDTVKSWREFDPEIFEKITGIAVPLEEPTE
jgi:hypothetical protein